MIVRQNGGWAVFASRMTDTGAPKWKSLRNESVARTQ